MLLPSKFVAERASIGFLLASLVGLLGAGFSQDLARAAAQGELEVSPEATPEIRQVQPSQAPAGGEVTVVIEGRNFSQGAYVSFSTPSVHAISTRRVSPTQLEAKLAINPKARPGPVSLYVSNPASAVAEAPFTIAVAPAEIKPSGTGTPEVTLIDPARATRGAQVSVKITGKNFVKGAKVSFSNPGIRVLETNSAMSTELVARIQVAPNAAAGKGSLFVVNPDDREAEVAFEVGEGGPARPGGPGAPSAPATETGTPPAQRFEVISLGEGINILQNPNKPKGTLTVAGGVLKYEESGKEIFSAPTGEIKEIDANVILGVNTGTFHIILNSGKTFNFVAASLRPADSQSIVGSLRAALK